MLTSESKHRFKLNSSLAFDEKSALKAIDAFEEFLWSGGRKVARTYLFSGLDTILSYADDGTYDRAMSSEEDMAELVERLVYETD